ncbi:epidermal retinol dehydrogenase 2 [Papilio machaon]|uniref:epidermal retinol dehydrogenase 2 n=1 Tax=Papilio machaon TaxID=76193 RepID=UPI001E663A19|nr:epidermal retinol dehydrogenase 2 [Papilio machaon]
MSRDNSPLRLIRELLWTLLVVNFEILRAIYRWFVPAERKDVAGQVVLITGTGHGMGREMALRFARLGAKVVCVDINAKNNEETYNMILAEKGKAYKYVCDVTDRAAVLQLAEQVRREAGDVYVLVNNAGIMPCKPITEQTEKEIRLMMDINVNANIWCIQAFLPAMIERNHGHIVAMSSMAGLMGIRNLVPYCGSKFAARGIMEALAIEVRDDPRDTSGIHFTTVCPYIVNTGLCHKPRIRFENAMKVVNADEAADMIVDAVLRNIMEITIPPELHYMNRYIYRLLPFPAAAAFNDFLDTGVDAHD